MLDERFEISKAIHAALKYLQEDNKEMVIEEVQRAFSLDPNSPEGVHVLGLCAAKLDEPIRAKDLFEKAVELAPDKHEHSEALAIINAKLGLLSDSLFYGKLAASLTRYEFISGFLPSWFGRFEESFMNIQEKPYFKLGKYHYDIGQFNQAIDALQKACAVDPKDVAAWRMLVHSLRISERSYEAILMHKALDSVGLNDPRDLSEVAVVLGDVGLFKESLSCHKEVLDFEFDNHRFFANFISTLQKAGLKEELEKAERDWATLFLEPIFSHDYHHLFNQSKERLCIGLVSGRFRSKNGLDHLVPLISNHGQLQMIFKCYSYNDYDDIISRKIAGSVRSWTDLSKIDDKTAATIIYNDNVDILINLDSNLEISHPKVFAYNPAPIMLKYLGSPTNTHQTGYAGVFGGKISYKNMDAAGLVTDFALAGFSPEINKDNIEASTMLNQLAPCIGLAPKGAELTPAFYEEVKIMTEAIPNSKILLNTGRLGCGGILDDIEKQLDAYDLKGKVNFSILDHDKYSAISDFVAQCDILIILEHMKSADIAWEFINSCKPVFAIKPQSAHLGEVGEILAMLGHENWYFATLDKLVSALKKAVGDGGAGYMSYTKKLHRSILKQLDGAQLADKGRALLEAFAAFRKEYFTTKIDAHSNERDI